MKECPCKEACKKWECEVYEKGMFNWANEMNPFARENDLIIRLKKIK